MIGRGYKLKDIPKINKEANEKNIKIFKRYECRNSEEKRYTCVLCGKKVSISESSSNNGHKLICSRCSYEYFSNGDMFGIDIRKRRAWMDDK